MAIENQFARLATVAIVVILLIPLLVMLGMMVFGGAMAAGMQMGGVSMGGFSMALCGVWALLVAAALVFLIVLLTRRVRTA